MNSETTLVAIPHEGFGDVRFGMTRDQVASVLGEASLQRRPVESGDGQDVEWGYPEHGVTLRFDRDDELRLGTISFEDQRTVLLGRCPLQKSETNLRAMFFGEPDLVLAFEDEYPFIDLRNYWCEQLGIQFFVEAGKLVEFSMFTRYQDDGPVWPSV